jgi:predicted membrane channel-forming protein YqfA (hemolysin III family)
VERGWVAAKLFDASHVPWFAFPLLVWGMILAVHGVYAFVMKTPEEIMIERRSRRVEAHRFDDPRR